MSNNEQPKKPGEVRLTIENSIKLDPKNPIPIQYGGESFYVVNNKKYIPFLGKEDRLPNLLLEARLTSTTQNACITTIANSVIGKGLVIPNKENPEANFLKWIANSKLNSKLLNIVEGERTFGNQFIEVIRYELNKTKYLKIHTHAAQYCRLSEPNDNDVPESVLISKLFARKGYKSIDLKKVNQIPLWNENPLDEKKVWKKNEDGSFSTMLHFKNEVNGIDYYGLPASFAGLRYQVLEGKSAQYNIDNFENNMILGGMLIFKSGMTWEEAQKNAKEILLTHVGEGKTGRIAVLSSESGLAEVDFKPFETQKEGSYIELDKRIEEKIIAANGWDPVLAGIHTGKSSLGNGSGYVRSIYDITETTLLNPLRNKLVDNVVMPIVKIYAKWFSKDEVKDYDYSFKSAMPFSFMGDIDPETFMKVKEARALAGLDADQINGEKYLSEMKSKNSNKKDVPTEPTTP